MKVRYWSSISMFSADFASPCPRGHDKLRFSCFNLKNDREKIGTCNRYIAGEFDRTGYMAGVTYFTTRNEEATRLVPERPHGNYFCGFDRNI